MVKADPKINYYLALDVAPNASTDEIKRQFRKLGQCSRGLELVACNMMRPSCLLPLLVYAANLSASEAISPRPQPRQGSRIRAKIPGYSSRP